MTSRSTRPAMLRTSYDLLLHVAETILPEEHLVADEEGRDAEGPAFEGALSVGGA